jgi:ABC-type Mn2+/Zn2+ transport system ATPase subunit
MTVSELLRFSVPPLYSFSLHGRKDETETIDRLLATVGARDLKDRCVGSLSGGELQRVMMAKAIVNEPKILFLDEPASGVDIEGQERFHDLVKRLNREKKLTVILISHDLNVVYRFADEVLCLNRRLVCSGIPERALTDEVIKSVYGEMMGAYIHSCHDHD